MMVVLFFEIFEFDVISIYSKRRKKTVFYFFTKYQIHMTAAVKLDAGDIAALGSNFKVTDVLGEGTYGVVFRAQSIATGALYAIKKLRLDGHAEGIPATAIREITLLQDVGVHPNIVRLLQVICHNRRVYLVFELMTEDLRKFIYRYAKHRQAQLPNPHESLVSVGGSVVPLPVVRHLTRQMLHALWHCHQSRIIHRDLKPGNILIDESGSMPNCKLADFGLARTFELSLVTYTNEVVTLWYRAPEVLLGEHRYTPAVDIWAVGCIVGEMIIGKALFRGDAQLTQLQKIFSLTGVPTEATWPGVSTIGGGGKRGGDGSALQKMAGLGTVNQVHRLFEFVKDPNVGSFVATLLALNPQDRATVSSALEHPFLKD